MELLFEIIFSIIFEGSIEGMKDKTIPLWIRILCALIVGFTFLFVIVLIGFLAIKIWKESNFLLALLFLSIDLIFIGCAIKMIKKKIN